MLLSWSQIHMEKESAQRHTLAFLRGFNTATSTDAQEACSPGHRCTVPPQQQQASHVSGRQPWVAWARTSSVLQRCQVALPRHARHGSLLFRRGPVLRGSQ